MNFIALPVLLLLLLQTFRLRLFVKDTTATGAHRWALAAVVACLFVALCSAGLADVSPKTLSAMRYFASVMLLTPLVAILGAREPGAKAWGIFVVLPLVVVLQWSSVSELSAVSAATPVTIPTPTIIGFLFVLLMGGGNYFGSLNTESMLAGSTGTLLILLPVTEYCSADNSWTFPVGSACLLLSAYLIPRQYFARPVREDSVDIEHARLWRDFRDLYGIVWAKRVADRFNQFAVREQLSVELTLDGFQTSGEAVASGEQTIVAVPDRAIKILCWILRRFAQPEFLRRYLPDAMVRDDQKLESP